MGIDTVNIFGSRTTLTCDGSPDKIMLREELQDRLNLESDESVRMAKHGEFQELLDSDCTLEPYLTRLPVDAIEFRNLLRVVLNSKGAKGVEELGQFLTQYDKRPSVIDFTRRTCREPRKHLTLILGIELRNCEILGKTRKPNKVNKPSQVALALLHKQGYKQLTDFSNLIAEVGAEEAFNHLASELKKCRGSVWTANR